LPSTAFEDDEIEITVSVKNNARLSRYMIEVIDSIPALEPSEQYPMTFIAKLRGRRIREYSYKVVCYKRGEYIVGPLALKSAYPLGISFVKSIIPENRPTLLVYPEVFEIARFPFISGSNVPISGMEAVSKAGGTDEFFGTREYKQGDSLRYIHWPSTARHSKLIVKEFEIRASTEATIFIDLHKDSSIGKGKENTLEYAVKIAASVSKYAIERGHSIQFIGCGKERFIVPYSKGLNHLASVMDALARVKSNGTLPYALAISQTAGLLKDGGTAVIIFSRSDVDIGEYFYSLTLLKTKRVKLVAICLNEHSFSEVGNDTAAERSPLYQWFISHGFPVYSVYKGGNLREVFSS